MCLSTRSRSLCQSFPVGRSTDEDFSDALDSFRATIDAQSHVVEATLNSFLVNTPRDGDDSPSKPREIRISGSESAPERLSKARGDFPRGVVNLEKPLPTPQVEAYKGAKTGFWSNSGIREEKEVIQVDDASSPAGLRRVDSPTSSAPKPSVYNSGRNMQSEKPRFGNQLFGPAPRKPKTQQQSTDAGEPPKTLGREVKSSTEPAQPPRRSSTRPLRKDSETWGDWFQASASWALQVAKTGIVTTYDP